MQAHSLFHEAAVHLHGVSANVGPGTKKHTWSSPSSPLTHRLHLTALLLLVLSSVALAQGGGLGFEIGVNQVYHSPYSPWQNSHVSTVDSLPDELWNRLSELGITMPMIQIHDVNDNYPRDLLDTAKVRGFRIAFIDPALRRASRWERRYVQAEDPEHVLSEGVAMRAAQKGFDEKSLRLDLADMVEHSRDDSNVLLFRESVHAPGTVLRARVNPRLLSIEGPYYLTVRCGVSEGAMLLPRNSDEAALLLRLRFGEDVRIWTIPGSAFFDGSGEPRHALEYLPADSTREALFTLHVDTVWQGTDSARVRYAVNPSSPAEWEPGIWEEDRGSYYQSRRRVLDRPASELPACTLELEYLGRGDIAVDALCFSDPHAYGLFIGDEHALQDFRDGKLRSRVVRRLQQIGVNTDPQNPLRFVELYESMPDDPGMATMNYIDALVDSLAGYSGKIRTFNYGNSGRGGQQVRTAVNGHIVSGYYFYPIWHKIPPPGHADYENSLFGNPVGNFWYASRRFHEHAVAQKLYAGSKPFLYQPPIANNDWSFTKGWRWSMPPELVVEELRESTAAELRAQVLHALCYGAKSIMYYQYGSMPSVQTADTLTADGRFINRGINGFVNVDMTKRRMDVWGEDKWDSVCVFNHAKLRSLGNALYPLRWENAFAYDDVWLRATDSVLVSVTSERLGLGTDPDASTFVEIGQFSDPQEPDALYLLVVNKRMDAHGQRHITVRVRPRGQAAARQLVTEMVSDSVQVFSSIQLATEGITMFYPAGGAHLFRLRTDTAMAAGQPVKTLQLHHNYPNPVRSATTVLFELPDAAPAQLSVHDAVGRQVAVLVDGLRDEGVHSYTWDARGIASGMYFIRLRQGMHVCTRAVLVIN